MEDARLDGDPARVGPAIVLPGGLRWSCIGCGRSCEDWDEVLLSAAEAERLRRLPIFNPRLPPPPAGQLPYRSDGEAAGELRLRFEQAPGAGSRCQLLDLDRRCAVHLAHGAEAKPASCRAFPFVFIETIGGTRAALSFACTAVVHDLGELVSAQAPAVDEAYRLASHRERRGGGTLLAAGTPLAHADYERLEAELISLLRSEGALASALFAQAALIRARAGLPPADPRASSRHHRHVLDWLVAESGLPRRFPPPSDLPPPDQEACLRRWVEHRLWRRDLLRGGEVLFAHGLLLAEVALARDWARSQAGGIATAIVAVERGLALHSDLVPRIERSLARRTTAGRLFAAPRHAASMLLSDRARS